MTNLSELSPSSLDAELVGLEVVYTKGGSRAGWVGVITDHTGGRTTITYHDTGVVQEYTSRALRFQSNLGDPYAYLEVRIPRQVKHRPGISRPISPESFLVVNNQTGELVSVELDQETAEAFAAEQVQDCEKPHMFTVFSAISSVQREVPKVSIISRVREKIKKVLD